MSTRFHLHPRVVAGVGYPDHRDRLRGSGLRKAGVGLIADGGTSVQRRHVQGAGCRSDPAVMMGGLPFAGTTSPGEVTVLF